MCFDAFERIISIILFLCRGKASAELYSGYSVSRCFFRELTNCGEAVEMVAISVLVVFQAPFLLLYLYITN